MWTVLTKARSLIGVQACSGQGGAERQSERTPMCVSEGAEVPTQA